MLVVRLSIPNARMTGNGTLLTTPATSRRA